MSSPFDLHVLSTPPAFILSQDQTLNKMVFKEPSGPSNQFYWSLILSFKEIWKSLSTKLLLVQENFLSSSGASCSFTLFNLQGARPASAAGTCLLYHTFSLLSSPFLNFFRSFSAPKVQTRNSHPAVRRPRSELLYDTISRSACQALFHFLFFRPSSWFQENFRSLQGVFPASA